MEASVSNISVWPHLVSIKCLHVQTRVALCKQKLILFQLQSFQVEIFHVKILCFFNVYLGPQADHSGVGQNLVCRNVKKMLGASVIGHYLSKV